MDTLKLITDTLLLKQEDKRRRIDRVNKTITDHSMANVYSFKLIIIEHVLRKSNLMFTVDTTYCGRSQLTFRRLTSTIVDVPHR